MLCKLLILERSGFFDMLAPIYFRSPTLMRLTPGFAVTFGISVFVLSVLINVFAVESVLRADRGERVTRCEKLGVGIVESYCLKRAERIERKEVAQASLHRFSEDADMTEGILSSVRSSA